ncbi:hypothetical protein LOAG_06292 [Loa loa]|uniref:Uncharacterized protein n=1 Tax=Loa loa TaxID=7209 RepID=A0A1S0TZT5_LOALO|nr:hypothetical protein LOAG_06292 [Loa loa]EFO22194.1 hypothetical protein LOAG_06292 [Loa loa]
MPNYSWTETNPKWDRYNWRNLSRIPRQRQKMITRRGNCSHFSQAGVALLEGSSNSAGVSLHIGIQLNSKYLPRLRKRNLGNVTVPPICSNQIVSSFSDGVACQMITKVDLAF